MFPDVKTVRYLHDYKLEIAFTDGICGSLDLVPWIVGKGGVFAPLEDKRYFASVQVNDEIGTIVWPNGVDLDPEVLYSRITGKPVPEIAIPQVTV